MNPLIIALSWNRRAPRADLHCKSRCRLAADWYHFLAHRVLKNILPISQLAARWYLATGNPASGRCIWNRLPSDNGRGPPLLLRQL